MELEAKIDLAKVVSFDIFDTLVFRIYRKPTDLFLHLERASGRKGFANARIKAERIAREEALQKKRQEVGIEDIYRKLEPAYADLMTQEMELELLACKGNTLIQPFFDYAKKRKKRIVITSDMYLPRDIIEKILERSGFTEYEKLFLSSEQMKTKAGGELYDEVIRYTKEKPENILHIGDHEYTDVQKAEEKGLRAYHYTQIKYSDSQMMHSQYFSVLNKYAASSPAASFLQGIVRENDLKNGVQGNTFKKDYWYHFGFNYIGILALGYVKWLRQQFEKDKIQKAYFMLRDGYIFQKVFEKIYPEFEVHEIVGSRRMFLFAGMQSFEDIRFHATGIHIKGLSYRNFWDRLYVENEELKSLYESTFHNLDKIITDQDEIIALEDFLQQHTEQLRQYGKQEREDILSYFQEIHLLEGKAAVVDLGWKCSMLKGICKLCDIEKIQHDLTGYYVGTHPCDRKGLKVRSYGIEDGVPYHNYPIGNVLNYAISILELAFSAPHPSVLKIKKLEDGFKPVYQNVVSEEQKRIDICKKILEGVLDFTDRYEAAVRKYPAEIDLNAALAPLEYLTERISQYDKKKIAEVCYFPGVGADDTHFPMTAKGMITMGVINPWPGDVSGEMEVVARIKQAADNIGIGCILLDNYGCVLDGQQQKTDRYIRPEEIDFAITTQYETHKAIDAFYYHALWNPPEIPLNLDYYYIKVTDNFLMNDDYLIYDSGGMTNHLKSVLYRKKRDLTGASMLTASCPESLVYEPNLDHPIMFYCGMNWERVVHNSNRHEGLFKLLDATKKVCFYGPKKVKAWGGIRPWEGYSCYKGSIPFDGHSIIKVIQKCGICLVLSSDIHRRAGAVTNRAYEACAAGAVIISDDNEFMLKWFKDAALFITYNKKDPRDTFRQIMEKYDWIVSHKKEALALAKRSQEIFRKYFALEKQLYNLVNHHASRFHCVREALFAKDDMRNRVIVTYVVTTQKARRACRLLKQVIQNVENQYYRNITVCIACDYAVYAALNQFLETLTARAQLYPMDLFDTRGSQKLTTGECICRLWKQADGKYYVNTVADEIWFYDHITTLVRAIEDEQAVAAYSGRLREEANGLRYVDSFGPISNDTVYHMQCPNWLPTPGQILFSESVKNLIPEYMFSCIDGYEHYAFLAFFKLKKRQKICFSKRMTYVTKAERKDSQCHILEPVFQIRFIRDLVHEEMAEDLSRIHMAQMNGISRREINEMLARIPLKLWVRVRIYIKKMMRANLNTKKGKKVAQKYNELLERFLNM